MKGLIPSIQLFLKRNASTILTCAGALGVAATAVSAVKATPNAIRILERAEEEKGSKLTRFEKIKAAGPVYIPAVAIGGSTIACIFGANVLNKRSQAALVSMYTLLDSSYKEYREKVKETLGEETNRKIVEGVALDHFTDEASTEEGKELFLDNYTMQLFESTMDDVLAAEKKVNDILRSRGYLFVSEYCEALGIKTFDPLWCYEYGWSQAMLISEYGDSELRFDHLDVIADGSRRYVITMQYEPVMNCLMY